MNIMGFSLFFVPEASAAVKFQNSSIHAVTTSIISQWIGEIIRFDDFMNIRKH